MHTNWLEHDDTYNAVRHQVHASETPQVQEAREGSFCKIWIENHDAHNAASHAAHINALPVE